jgi:hypothetical protein
MKLHFVGQIIFYLFILTACSPKVADPSASLVANQPVNQFTVSVENKYYLAGQTINIALTHPWSVNVAGGTPKLTLDIGGSMVDAPLTAGSGTNQLIFSYTVVMNDLDTNGIGINSSIDLSGATIKYTDNSTLIDANTTLTLPSLAGVKVDAITPTISSVATPAAKTYYFSESLDFDVTFSESVVIVGSPRMSLDFAGTIVQAQYLSGSGGSLIKFRKVVANNESDLDGIALASPLLLNSGSIKDVAGNSANLAFLPPSASGVIVNGEAPVITSITKPNNGTYLIGQNLDFTLVFNKTVNVTGSPQIDLAIEGSNVSLLYTSGSGSNQLIFRYQVQMHDYDLNGIELGQIIKLQGGSINDVNNNAGKLSFDLISLGGVLVNAAEPMIVDTRLPQNKSYSTSEGLFFDIEFSEAVNITGTPKLAINLNTGVVYANYFSGSGSKIIKFRYIVNFSEFDNDGIALNSPLNNSSGDIIGVNTIAANLSFTAPDASSIFVNDSSDTTAPTIISVTPPSNDTYTAGENLDFTATWSENVTISGSPRLTLDIGGVTRYATYQAGLSSSTVSIFRYTVVNPDLDLNGISVSPNLALNSATIQDASLNNAQLTFSAPNTSAVLIDANAPTISSVAAPSDATYYAGNVLTFTVHFSKTVTLTGSDAILNFKIGTQTRAALCLANTGLSTTCSYEIQSGEYDANGIEILSPFVLNTATAVDQIGNNLNLNFTPNATPDVLVNSEETTVVEILAPSDGIYGYNHSLQFSLRFSKVMTVAGSPLIELNIEGRNYELSYDSGSGSNILNFILLIPQGLEDLDGVALGSNINLNSGEILDINQFPPNMSLPTIDTSGIKVDSILPHITALQPVIYQSIFHAGDTIQFRVQFNEIVTITGNPLIYFEMGHNVGQLIIPSGTAQEFIAEYVVQASDIDLDGINLVTPLELNGASIVDAVNNEIQRLDFDLPDSQYNLISNPLIDLWLDANDQYFVFEDAGCSSRARPGSQVMCWLDKSINNFQLIQNDPASSPQLITSNLLPSRTNSISFDGTSSFLYQTNAPTVGIVFLVFVSNNGAGSNDVMLWGEKFNNKAVQLSPRSINTMILNSSHPNAPTGDQIAQVVMQNGSTTGTGVYVNETARRFWSKSTAELAQITYRTNSSLQNQYLGSYDGASNFLDGEIAEVIVLNDRNATPEIVSYIEKYLRMKYRMP